MSLVTDFVIERVKESKSRKDDIAVCEIGVGKGDTSKRITKLLGRYDRYYYFDFTSKVDKIKSVISESECVKLGFGNSRKYYDSYAWNLAKIYLNQKEMGLSTQIFDVVFLDGSNIFIHDLSACAILKKMVMDQGIIIVNNINWTFAKSKYWNPKNNPETEKMLSDEMINESQTNVVCRAIFDGDPQFEKIDSPADCKAFVFVGS